MMNFLKTLLSLSVSGSILILVLFFLKIFIKDKTSRKWQYYIWLIVIARLLIPFAPEMCLVNQGFQKIASPVQSVTHIKSFLPQDEKASVKSIKWSETGEIEKDSLSEDGNTPSTMKMSFLIQMSLMGIWIMVALILFIHKISTYRRFTRYIKRESAEVSGLEHLELLGDAVEHMKVKRTIGLYRNSTVASPLLVGFRKASIVLPTLDMDNSDIYYTFLHELIHCKRRDMLYKWLVQLTICIHWFNPLVRLMGREILHACELSCDEAVIRNLSEESKRTYGDTLLKAARINGSYNNSLATVALIENKEILKERLDSIMNYRKKTKSILCVTLILTLILCGGAVGLGAYRFGEPVKAATKEDSSQINSYSINDKTIEKADTKGANFGLRIDSSGNISSIERGYYRDAYVFLIRWNNKKKDKNTTKAEVKLFDQSVKTVYFDNSCKNNAKEKAVLSALGNLMSQILKNPKEDFMTDADPIVVKLLYVGTDLKKVAETYYSKKNIWVFSSVLSELDSKLLQQYAKQAYEDDRIDFFSMVSDNLSKEELISYAKTAYESDRIDFFSVLSESLSQDDLKALAKRAYEADRIDFFSILSENLSKEELKALAQKAYEDDRIDFFGILSENLGKEELKTLAQKAYEDDRIDFFSMLTENMSIKDIKAFLTKALKDGKTSFFHILSDK